MLYDDLTNYGWLQILQQCIQIPEEDLIRINFPQSEQVQENSHIKIYAGYVKPGRHVVLVYSNEQIYKREVVIRARKLDVNIPQWVGGQQQPRNHRKVRMTSEEDPQIHILDFQEFVFKDWYFDSTENLHIQYQNEITPQNLNLDVINNIEKNLSGEEF